MELLTKLAEDIALIEQAVHTQDRNLKVQDLTLVAFTRRVDSAICELRGKIDKADSVLTARADKMDEAFAGGLSARERAFLKIDTLEKRTDTDRAQSREVQDTLKAFMEEAKIDRLRNAENFERLAQEIKDIGQRTNEILTSISESHLRLLTAVSGAREDNEVAMRSAKHDITELGAKVKQPGMIYKALASVNVAMFGLASLIIGLVLNRHFHERFFDAVDAALNKMKWWL